MDWIKMRVDLYRNPKTIKLKKVLLSTVTERDGALRGLVTLPSLAVSHLIVGGLLIVWGTVNEHIGEEDFCPGMAVDDLDEITSIPGFGAAMVSSGWAREAENGVRFPNFREFNTPQKERYTPKSGAERQRQYRDKKKRDESVTRSDGTQRNARDGQVTDSDVALRNARDVTVTQSDGDKNREEENRDINGTSPKTPPQEKKTKGKDPFRVPTYDEVKSYCDERKNKVNAARFVDFYASKGWMIGKNRMKDWKAAVHTWEQNDGNGKQSPSKPSQTAEERAAAMKAQLAAKRGVIEPGDACEE